MTLEIVKSFTYEGEGWGICFDGEYLIMSDGSSNLSFYNTDKFSKLKTLSIINWDGKSLNNINELEYVYGLIYANVWMSDSIFVINPKTGKVVREIDCSKIVPETDDINAVLNGIAHIDDNEFYLMGKSWDKYYKVKIPKN